MSPVDLDSKRPDEAHLIEAAEAQAVEAEALAAAARARVRAIRERQRAETTDTASPPIAEAGADEKSAHPEAEESADAPCAAAEVADLEISPTAGVAGDKSRRRAASKWKSRRLARPKLTTVLGGIGIVCAAALLAMSAVMVHHHDQLVGKRQRAAEFAAAARQVVVTLMSINADTAKADVQHIIDSSTGQFRDEFRGAADDFIKVAQSAKVSTKTTVQDAAVEAMTDDTAVVLVAARSTLINTAGASEQPRSWRLSLKLARDDGKIKMSSMEFIP
ncbi:hypothetical protein [Mycobacterium ahvazicum]|uniref:hypothetical protein n=1 Tax=Mycobacterium ahvazicum TaxID=1964395 RepID=UPI001FAEE4B2|nr:hypothetical protein [Mycobacterium ahvazicum]